MLARLEQIREWQEPSTVETRETLLPATLPKNVPAEWLLRLHADILAELRRRRICRSSNNPVADYAEGLVAKALRLTLAGKSATGFDATDASGRCYEIKARRITASGKVNMLSAIRGLEKRHFDFLVAVIFNEDYTVHKALQVPFETIQRIAKFRKHVDGHIVMIRDLWQTEGVRDITPALKSGTGQYCEYSSLARMERPA